MADAEKLGLPLEVLIPKQEYSYNVRITPNIMRRDVQIFMTFKFEGTPPLEFKGTEEYSNLESEDKKCEAESFIEAAGDAWKRFRYSEKRRGFVKDELEKKWNQIRGEYFTHKKLIFDVDSDEIIAPQKPKSK